MEKLSIFKKLRLHREYRILLKRHRKAITNQNNGLNLRIDRVGRIYTVYTCPDDVRKYGADLAEKYIKEYISKVSAMLTNLGLIEYVGVRDINQIIEYSELDFLVVFGFKGFDTAVHYRRLVIFGSVMFLSIIGYFLFFF